MPTNYSVQVIFNFNNNGVILGEIEKYHKIRK